jgi:hypothetical protein
MRSIEEIAAEILALPNESRVILADKLVKSLGQDTDSIIQTVWKNEERRHRSGLLLAAIDASIEGVVFQTEGEKLLKPCGMLTHKETLVSVNFSNLQAI